MQTGIMKSPAIPFIAPFILFIAALGLRAVVSIDPFLEYTIRVVAVSAAVVIFSRGAIDWHVSHMTQSVLVGLAVFAIWIGPDLLISGYRNHILFQNSVVGSSASSIPLTLRSNWAFLAIRIFGTA